jgi:hypothetical protein
VNTLLHALQVLLTGSAFLLVISLTERSSSWRRSSVVINCFICVGLRRTARSEGNAPSHEPPAQAHNGLSQGQAEASSDRASRPSVERIRAGVVVARVGQCRRSFAAAGSWVASSATSHRSSSFRTTVLWASGKSIIALRHALIVSSPSKEHVSNGGSCMVAFHSGLLSHWRSLGSGEVA